MKVGALLCLLSSAEADVHPERAAQVEAINNSPGVLWKAKAHPRFARLAPGASASMNGVFSGTKEHLEHMVQAGEMERVEAAALGAAELPESFDSIDNWPECAAVLGDIRDQSNCGCCWAFAGAEAASDRMCIATKAAMQYTLSSQDVCFNSGMLLSHGCNGGQISTPWTFMQKGRALGGKGAVSGAGYNGTETFGAKNLCSDFSLPHCHHHGPQGDDPYPAEGEPGCPSESSPKGPKSCDDKAADPHSDFASDKHVFDGKIITASGEANIQAAIMAGGPMETAFTVYSDFEDYDGGIYHHVSGSAAGGHAVKFVGWGVEDGVKYWKVANSWNPHWGEKGYFRIQRGNNEGGIEDSATASAPDAVWSRKGGAKVVAV